MNLETRPRYFTEHDRVAEADIAAVISGVWQCHLERLSEWAYRIDYAVCELPGWRCPVLGFLEIKDRPNLVVGQNSGYQIALHKLTFARILTTGTNLKALLSVRACTGEIYVVDLLRYRPSKVILSGRRDRNTLGDIEPMAILPWENWSKVEVFDYRGERP
jgi:hypothetical protein